MLPQEKVIEKISLELSQIYRKKVGRDPDSKLIRDEAENICAKFGPITALKDLFCQGENPAGSEGGGPLPKTSSGL